MRQEDVDTGWLFGNFLQFPAFRATPRPRNPSPFSAELSWLERWNDARAKIARRHHAKYRAKNRAK
jgi:hypothetical protein